MPNTVEAGSAGRRLPASAGSFAGATDLSELAATTQKIQTARIRARVDVSPAVAAVIGALAYGSAETWRARA